MFMSVYKIYFAHIYEGKEENKRDLENIIRKARKEHNIIPISPIHAFGWLYNETEYDEGMKLCLELLKTCDELWLCPGWINSKGCLIEREEAYKLGIPIKEIRL